MSDPSDQTPTAPAASSDDSSVPRGKCGKCGYLIHRQSGFTCPECGSDLREVGIVTSRRRAGARTNRIFRLIAVALCWALICWVPMGILYEPVFLHLWPRRAYSNRAFRMRNLNESSGNVRFNEHINGTLFGGHSFSRPLADFASRLTYDLDATVSGPNGASLLHADLIHDMAWRRTGKSPEKNSDTPLDKNDVLDWLDAAGFDRADPETQKTAATVFGIFSRAHANIATGASFDSLVNGGSPDLRSTAPLVEYSSGGLNSSQIINMTPAWIVLSLLFYATGLGFWYRRLRRRSAARAADIGAISAAPSASPGLNENQPSQDATQGSAAPAFKNRLLSIMFSDIKDYTAHSSMQSRAAVLEMVRRHRECVGPVVMKHGGRVVKEMGDGILTAFDSATDAVLAGLEIQKSAAGSGGAQSPATPLELRIGISTGEVTVQANDVFGSAVNLASRVQQIAEPGRVFFTEATFAMLNVQEAPASEVGVVELKGIPQPVKVYQALGGNSASQLQRQSPNGETKA